jgi:hypothetical protein
VTPEPISRCEKCGKPWSVKTCPDCIRAGTLRTFKKERM